MTTYTRLRPHPTEGWDEQRIHPDGVSYWRFGEPHRSSGWAIDRDGAREAWLFGHRIPSPDHAPSDPLTFAGQSGSGELSWVDGHGRTRVLRWQTAAGVEETRLLGADGGYERHWRNGHHATRVLCTGERRYYELHDGAWRLHRLGAPAIEHAGTHDRALWFEHGIGVDSPLAILNDAKRLARAQLDAGLAVGALPLDRAQFDRLAARVATTPDDELAWELSIAFPSAWIAGMRVAEPNPPFAGA